MKWLIFLIFFITKLSSIELTTTQNLKDNLLMFTIANGYNLAITTSHDIDIDVNIETNLSANEYVKLMNSIIYNKNLQLIVDTINKVLILQDLKQNEKTLTTQYYKLKYVEYSQINELLTVLDFKHTYIKDVDVIAITGENEKLPDLIKLLSDVDVQLEKKKFKISIIEINLGKLKQYEGIINASLPTSTKNIINLALGSVSLVSNNQIDRKSLTAALKFLDINNISRTLTNTTINLVNNRKIQINSSQNIPFISQSNIIDDVKTNQINKIDYKDVGLILNIIPKFRNDFFELDFSFDYSAVLSLNNNMPITSKKELKQTLILDIEKDIHIIAGINNFTNMSKNEDVPYVSKIPIIGNLFKNQYIDNTMTSTTIIIELLDDKKEFDITFDEKQQNNINSQDSYYNQTLKQFGF
ncbi:MAG: hypothetical protein AB7E13_04770 [Arcobacteraceae bacterium]